MFLVSDKFSCQLIMRIGRIIFRFLIPFFSLIFALQLFVSTAKADYYYIAPIAHPPWPFAVYRNRFWFEFIADGGYANGTNFSGPDTSNFSTGLGLRMQVRTIQHVFVGVTSDIHFMSQLSSTNFNNQGGTLINYASPTITFIREETSLILEYMNFGTYNVHQQTTNNQQLSWQKLNGYRVTIQHQFLSRWSWSVSYFNCQFSQQTVGTQTTQLNNPVTFSTGTVGLGFNF